MEGEQQMDTTLTNVSNEPDVDVEAVNMEVVVELPVQPHILFFHEPQLNSVLRTVICLNMNGSACNWCHRVINLNAEKQTGADLRRKSWQNNKINVAFLLLIS